MHVVRTQHTYGFPCVCFPPLSFFLFSPPRATASKTVSCVPPLRLGGTTAGNAGTAQPQVAARRSIDAAIGAAGDSRGVIALVGNVSGSRRPTRHRCATSTQRRAKVVTAARNYRFCARRSGERLLAGFWRPGATTAGRRMGLGTTLVM